MKTRYGVSPWILGVSEARRPSYPRFRGEARADVVVMGGGLTGCATAYALAQAGLRPVVVEAGRVGQGSAGRSAGLLLPEPGPEFRALTGAHGLRVARTVLETWRRGALDAAALLRRLGIRCALEPCDGLLAAPPVQERALRREYDARQGAGFDAVWLGERQLRQAAALEAGIGLRVHGAFVLDPYRACLGLASAARKRGARIFEQAHVRKVRAGSKDVEIVLDGGTIRAGTVVVATNMATMEFKPLRRHFKPQERYLVMTEPVTASVRRQMLPGGLALQDTQTPPHCVRWTADHRIVVAGADQPETPARQRSAVLTQRTGQLMYRLLTLYPAISGLRPEHGWEAAYGATADGLMYIGAHRNYPRHLFALGGGDSTTGSFVAARILARAVQGRPQKGDEVLGWTR